MLDLKVPSTSSNGTKQDEARTVTASIDNHYHVLVATVQDAAASDGHLELAGLGDVGTLRAAASKFESQISPASNRVVSYQPMHVSTTITSQL